MYKTQITYDIQLKPAGTLLGSKIIVTEKPMYLYEAKGKIFDIMDSNPRAVSLKSYKVTPLNYTTPQKG